MDTGDDADTIDDSTAQVISDLLAQGAELNATMDKTGETSLHLAARYARADAAKKLLEAGADANCQDNTGRTPLHAAVAADAMGVFQILLRNRVTNLNSRMHDGTTPLILAARLAIEGMVDDLISADADINASDNSGKTALHWAAAVNNVDAVNILLYHNANRDAQDDKDETPLFLAAREGSHEACKALLDNFANREISDHMDRLPKDVATERLHHDIVRLLEEHVPRSPQMVTVLNNVMIGSPNQGGQLISQPTIINAGKQQQHNQQSQQAMQQGVGVNGGPGVVANGKHKKARKSGPDSPLDGLEGTGASVRKKATAKKSSAAAQKKALQAQQVQQQQQQQAQALAQQQATLAHLQGNLEMHLSPTESHLSSVESPSPYDSTSLYTNAMQSGGMQQQQLMENGNVMGMPGKVPPSYEDCVKVRRKEGDAMRDLFTDAFLLIFFTVKSIGHAVLVESEL